MPHVLTFIRRSLPLVVLSLFSLPLHQGWSQQPPVRPGAPTPTAPSATTAPAVLDPRVSLSTNLTSALDQNGPLVELHRLSEGGQAPLSIQALSSTPSCTLRLRQDAVPLPVQFQSDCDAAAQARLLAPVQPGTCALLAFQVSASGPTTPSEATIVLSRGGFSRQAVATTNGFYFIRTCRLPSSQVVTNPFVLVSGRWNGSPGQHNSLTEGAPLRPQFLEIYPSEPSSAEQPSNDLTALALRVDFPWTDVSTLQAQLDQLIPAPVHNQDAVLRSLPGTTATNRNLWQRPFLTTAPMCNVRFQVGQSYAPLEISPRESSSHGCSAAQIAEFTRPVNRGECVLIIASITASNPISDIDLIIKEGPSLENGEPLDEDQRTNNVPQVGFCLPTDFSEATKAFSLGGRQIGQVIQGRSMPTDGLITVLRFPFVAQDLSGLRNELVTNLQAPATAFDALLRTPQIRPSRLIPTALIQGSSFASVPFCGVAPEFSEDQRSVEISQSAESRRVLLARPSGPHACSQDYINRRLMASLEPHRCATFVAYSIYNPTTLPSLDSEGRFAIPGLDIDLSGSSSEDQDDAAMDAFPSIELCNDTNEAAPVELSLRNYLDIGQHSERAHQLALLSRFDYPLSDSPSHNRSNNTPSPARTRQQ